MPLPLIDKQDSSEIVRDQIAGILLTELANQQALATTAGKDPLDWTLDVFVERDWPVERWLNASLDLTADTVPVVSIQVEQSSRNDAATSVPKGRQVFDVTYLIDTIARGVTTDVPGGGHVPADKAAHLNCQAANRLVRNILAALPYRFLELRAIVWAHPAVESMEFGPVKLDETEPSLAIWGCRMRFKVTMTESSPELPITGTLNLIRVDISDDGGVVLSTDIP